MRLEQDPIHRHKDVLAHTIAVVAKTRPDLRGPPGRAARTTWASPRPGRSAPKGVSFHHHEVVGARMARDRMRALRYSNELIDDVARLVFLHLRFHGYRDDVWSDTAVRRYARDAGPLLDDLNELTRCDCTTRNERKARMLAARMDALEAPHRRAARARGAGRHPARPRRQPGDGRCSACGPGRVVGEALDMLLEARLDEGPLGEEEAERRLRSWYEARQAADA